MFVINKFVKVVCWLIDEWKDWEMIFGIVWVIFLVIVEINSIKIKYNLLIKFLMEVIVGFFLILKIISIFFVFKVFLKYVDWYSLYYWLKYRLGM